MKIVNYIYFDSIYEEVRRNQLENYPTSKQYIEELKCLDKPHDYVEEMYHFLLKKPSETSISGMDELSDNDCIDVENRTLIFEFSMEGNNATENGDDFWGYGWTFTVDLENELFIGFNFENYS